MNFVGIICAIAAGVAQPACVPLSLSRSRSLSPQILTLSRCSMTILFGNLTTAFTNYGGLTMVNAQGATPELIAEARRVLFREVNKDVLILVYIGIATRASLSSVGALLDLLVADETVPLALLLVPSFLNSSSTRSFPTTPRRTRSRRDLGLHVHLDLLGRDDDSPHPRAVPARRHAPEHRLL